MPKQIPVYLFVGQLESGKTKFIQETMEDPNFDSGDKTLLLVCEEGEIEYDPSKFAFGGVHVAQIEDKSELTAENLTALEKKSGCGRVIIEYNGMWLIQDLYDALPDNWLVYQSLATADGTTIKTYAGDSAMRSLLLDKLRGSELLVVNRAEAVNDDEDEHEHHHEHHYDEHGVCSCGHHHHHDHDADEVFTSWGKETAHKYSREDLDKALHALDEGAYGMILRAKGIVDGGDTWYEFDMVPGEHEIRPCGPDVTGKLCVIGSQLKEHEIAELFHV